MIQLPRAPNSARVIFARSPLWGWEVPWEVSKIVRIKKPQAAGRIAYLGSVVLRGEGEQYFRKVGRRYLKKYLNDPT